MLAHFGAIAQSTTLPVIVYNIPGRTGVNMLPETLLELADRHANLAGVKESSGDLKQIGMILRQRRDGFVVWAGDDHLFLPSLALGADGVVGVASHLCSPEYRRMVDAYRGGRIDEAAQIHASLLPLIDALFATTSPIPVKWAMRELGFAVGECRLPLDAMPSAVADRLRPLIAPIRFASEVAVNSLEILGCRLDPIDADDATARIVRLAREGEGAQVVTLGTEMVVHAQHDERFRGIVNASALSLCDTVGLLAIARRRGAGLRERVTGVELIEHVVRGRCRAELADLSAWRCRRRRDRCRAGVGEAFSGFARCGCAQRVFSR